MLNDYIRSRSLLATANANIQLQLNNQLPT